MNYIERSVYVDDVDYLYEASAAAVPDDSDFAVADLLGIRRRGRLYDRLGFFRCHAMAGGMIEVPLIPPEGRNYLYKKIGVDSSHKCSTSSPPTARFAA